MSKPTLIVVAGPTASGKTNLSIALAKHFQTEILSADSRQFYKDLSIGTAKPSPVELAEVRHHFINTLSLEQDYNISRFESDALGCLEHLFQKKNVAILCGGSGLYIQAVCNGMDNLPERNPGIREELNALFAQNGIAALQEKLKVLDPEFYGEVDLSNTHRLVRAIEVCLATGQKYSTLRKGKSMERYFRVIKIALAGDREQLYKNINDRVDQMVARGLEAEARAVFVYKHLNSLNTVGYKELFDFFDGKTDRETAILRIKQNTRNYAKRQLTWFKRDPGISWFHPSATTEIIRFLEQRLQG